jgi:hypothetical protein
LDAIAHALQAPDTSMVSDLAFCELDFVVAKGVIETAL